jgi:hypothetical protein
MGYHSMPSIQLPGTTMKRSFLFALRVRRTICIRHSLNKVSVAPDHACVAEWPGPWSDFRHGLTFGRGEPFGLRWPGRTFDAEEDAIGHGLLTQPSKVPSARSSPDGPGYMTCHILRTLPPHGAWLSPQLPPDAPSNKAPTSFGHTSKEEETTPAVAYTGREMSFQMLPAPHYPG